jgi:cobalt-precorrin 5A hydrolase
MKTYHFKSQRTATLIAVITLSREGVRVATRIAKALEADLFLHRSVKSCSRDLPIADQPTRAVIGRSRLQPALFDRVASLTRRVFSRYRGFVYVMPCGVAVRAIAPCIRHKLSDPAVVVVDVGGRHAVSLLSGHEGGANALAFAVANCIGAEPVISTTTEAVKDLIVGVGCRRGIPAAEIVRAVRATLKRRRLPMTRVRLLASADVKADETGLITAAARLGLPLRFISAAEITGTTRRFTRSRFVQQKVGLPAVAEPAALLAGKRTELICPKQKFEGITVAVARENFS